MKIFQPNFFIWNIHGFYLLVLWDCPLSRRATTLFTAPCCTAPTISRLSTSIFSSSFTASGFNRDTGSTFLITTLGVCGLELLQQLAFILFTEICISIIHPSDSALHYCTKRILIRMCNVCSYGCFTTTVMMTFLFSYKIIITTTLTDLNTEIQIQKLIV